MWKFGLMAGLFAVLGLAAHADGGSIVLVNGQSMIALRSFGQHFGAVIGYNDGLRAIDISLGRRDVDLVPYGRTAWIDGAPYTLAQPPVIIDDVTYVPLGFLCTAFDLNYGWQGQQMVIVTPARDRVFFALDVGWSSRPHVWRRDYDARDYQNYSRPAHQYTPQQHGNYSRQPSWNHGRQQAAGRNQSFVQRITRNGGYTPNPAVRHSPSFVQRITGNQGRTLVPARGRSGQQRENRGHGG